MPQANFAYAEGASDAAGLPLALSIFADRPHLREEMRGDALAAGFRVALAGEIASLLEGEAAPNTVNNTVECFMRMYGLTPAEAKAIANVELPTYVTDLFELNEKAA